MRSRRRSQPGVGLRLVNEAGATLLAMDNREPIGPQGWAVSYRMYQPTLERMLRDGLARFPAVTLHVSTQVTAIGQDTDLAWLDVLDLESGRSRRVTARYVVGCDGASSTVRTMIGSRFQSLAPDQPYLVVDAKPERRLDTCGGGHPLLLAVAPALLAGPGPVAALGAEVDAGR